MEHPEERSHRFPTPPYPPVSFLSKCVCLFVYAAYVILLKCVLRGLPSMSIDRQVVGLLERGRNGCPWGKVHSLAVCHQAKLLCMLCPVLQSRCGYLPVPLFYLDDLF